MARALAFTSANQAVQQPTNAPKLAVFVRFAEQVSFEESFTRAEKAGVAIASNMMLTQALKTNKLATLMDALPCNSGTMTAYEEPGRKLRKLVELTDPDTDNRWVFFVPYHLMGAIDAVLVVEHPNYTLEIDGKNRVVHPKDESLVDLVPNFPSSDGWYEGDPKHGIPQGMEVDSVNQDAFLLRRTDSRIGLLVRGVNYHWGVVSAQSPSSYGFGMLVEAHDGSIVQVSDLAIGKTIIILPPQPQIVAPSPVLVPNNEEWKRQVKQALADLDRPYTPKYPRGY